MATKEIPVTQLAEGSEIEMADGTFRRVKKIRKIGKPFPAVEIHFADGTGDQVPAMLHVTVAA